MHITSYFTDLETGKKTATERLIQQATCLSRQAHASEAAKNPYSKIVVEHFRGALFTALLRQTRDGTCYLDYLDLQPRTISPMKPRKAAEGKSPTKQSPEQTGKMGQEEEHTACPQTIQKLESSLKKTQADLLASNRALESTQAALERAQKKTYEGKGQNAPSREAYEKLQASQQSLQKELDALQQTLQKTLRDKENYQQRNKEQASRIDALAQALREEGRNIEVLKRDLRTSKKLLGKERNALKQVQTRHAQANRVFQQTSREQQKTIHALQSEGERLQKALEEAQTRLKSAVETRDATIHQALTSKEAQIRRLEDRFQVVSTALGDAETALKSLVGEHDRTRGQLSQKIEKQQGAIQELQSEKEQLAKSLSDAQSNFSYLEIEKGKADRALHENKRQLQSLKDALASSHQKLQTAQEAFDSKKEQHAREQVKLQARGATQETTIRELQSTRENLQKTLHEAQADMDRLRKAEEEQVDRLRTQATKITDLSSRLAQAEAIAARKAQRVRSLEDSLRVAENYQQRNKEQASRIDALAQALREEGRSIEVLKRDLRTSKELLRKEQNALKEVQTRHAQAKKAFQETSREQQKTIHALQSEGERLQKALGEAQTRLKSAVETRDATIHQALTSKEAQIRRLEDRFQTVSTALGDAETALKSLVGEHDRTRGQLSQKIEKQQGAIQELQSEKEQLAKSLSDAQSNFSHLEIEKGKADKALHENKRQLQSLKDALASSHQKLQTAQEAFDSKKEQHAREQAELQARGATQETTIRELQSTRENLQKTLHEAQADMDRLRKAEEEEVDRLRTQATKKITNLSSRLAQAEAIAAREAQRVLCLEESLRIASDKLKDTEIPLRNAAILQKDFAIQKTIIATLQREVQEKDLALKVLRTAKGTKEVPDVSRVPKDLAVATGLLRVAEDRVLMLEEARKIDAKKYARALRVSAGDAASTLDRVSSVWKKKVHERDRTIDSLELSVVQLRKRIIGYEEDLALATKDALAARNRARKHRDDATYAKAKIEELLYEIDQYKIESGEKRKEVELLYALMRDVARKYPDIAEIDIEKSSEKATAIFEEKLDIGRIKEKSEENMFAFEERA